MHIELQPFLIIKLPHNSLWNIGKNLSWHSLLHSLTLWSRSWIRKSYFSRKYSLCLCLSNDCRIKLEWLIIDFKHTVVQYKVQSISVLIIEDKTRIVDNQHSAHVCAIQSPKYFDFNRCIYLSQRQLREKNIFIDPL